MMRHVPVLHTMVLSILRPRPGETVLDVTLGLGGHASAFLDAIGPTGCLIGLDADPRNLHGVEERLGSHVNATLMHANFRDLETLALPTVDVLFADLGLSSPHVDDPARGFSFRAEGPLDLRYDPDRGESAAALIERTRPEDLAKVLRTYGEFPGALRLARELAGQNLRTTMELRRIVEGLYGYRAPQILPRVFQALRIAVNDEMGALAVLLRDGPRLLRPGGRMGVISYHSLEDRPVKRAFRAVTQPGRDPFTGRRIREAPFLLLTAKVIVPDDAEAAENPRARSAKFRAIQRR